MTRVKKFFASYLCCLLITTSAFGTVNTNDEYKSAITVARSKIWQAINSGSGGSATVAIMVDGNIVYAEGFGMANREASIPVDQNTLFNIGSISKVYVATAIMLLVDDGLVSLDKPVINYLPEFKMADPRYKNITVRMLLNHTSGLPGTESANTFGFKFNDKVLQETINVLATAHLKHNPGAMAPYCNDGFTLAEMIVERVSGKKYIDFLKERIFTLLNLKNTDVGVGGVNDKITAAFYDVQTGKKHPLEILSLLGAGGLSATAIDLCRFADIFSDANTLLKQQSLNEMKQAQPSTFQLKYKTGEGTYGLGWDFTNIPKYSKAGIQVFGKTGGTPNYSAIIYTIPDKRIAVAVIICGSNGLAPQIALSILDEIMVEKKIFPSTGSLLIPLKPQKIPKHYATFNGYYSKGGNLFQVVFNLNKKLVNFYEFACKEKIPVFSLIYNNGYFYDAKQNRFAFMRINDEDCVLLELEKTFGIEAINMQKIKNIAIPKNLKINLDEKLWLRCNAYPFEGITVAQTYIAKSLLYKNLRGYVYFDGLKKIETPTFAGMPFNTTRDQTELTLFDKNGTTWAQVSSVLYSPVSNAAILKIGKNMVRIASDGYNKWFVAHDDMIVNFTKPEHGRIIVFLPDSTVKYDSAIDTGDVYVAKDNFITFSGYVGDEFVIKGKLSK
jgi:CubicO group peptidase (beta-lactamase class C family)